MGFHSPHLASILHDPQHNRLLRLCFPHEDGPAASLLANRLDAVHGRACRRAPQSPPLSEKSLRGFIAAGCADIDEPRIDLPGE